MTEDLSVATKADLSTDMKGHVAPGFETVADAFAANFSAGLEVGATFVVTLEGEVVVDLRSGYADAARSAPMGEAPLFAIWSATKGATATCIALLVERGMLDYEMPVARWWPEFADAGKGSITLGQMMSHQAGICGVRAPISLDDYYGHEKVARLLAAETPFFEPGTALGYHALAIGALADELVRRVDGRTVAAYFREELAVPLGLDMFMGLPESERHRVAETVPPSGDTQYSLTLIPNQAAFDAAVLNPQLVATWANDPQWQAAGIPAGGMMASARGLARHYAMLANDGRLDSVELLSPTTIAAASRQRAEGIDQVTGLQRRLSAGYQLNIKGRMGPDRGAFGHPGWGGTIGFADPANRVSVAYVAGAMVIDDPEGMDPRLARLLPATYGAPALSRRK
ncbi:serine hydrolase domain-containing protein [Sphingobium sp. WCS2017Hpa-17]|uniref:serine hydrolase domain-containing protein n=1 Tax=Sphingobium sp. WCS2017Hpa-17 TaxID=3073638 RepID=UPI00288AD8BF|nr:serine hydrolase domain-containing protein [Sphingobium sp. WCS2017Hpa-17]